MSTAAVRASRAAQLSGRDDEKTGRGFWLAVLGGIAALLFLTDGLLGGRYLGKRMMLYMPAQDLDAHRLAIGFGLSGLALALLNWLVVEFATKDQWLFYTTFADTPVAFAGLFWALWFARARVQPA